jgi:hypothetical protein
LLLFKAVCKHQQEQHHRRAGSSVCKANCQAAVLLALYVILQLLVVIATALGTLYALLAAAAGERGIGGSKCGATAVNTPLFTAPDGSPKLVPLHLFCVLTRSPLLSLQASAALVAASVAPLL